MQYPSNGNVVPQKRFSESEDKPTMSMMQSRGGPGSIDGRSNAGDSNSKKKRVSLSCAQCEWGEGIAFSIPC